MQPKVYVEIEKRFVGGNLVGVVTRDRLTEPNRGAAEMTLMRYQNAIFLGTEMGGRGYGSPYIITDAKIIEEKL